MKTWIEGSLNTKRIIDNFKIIVVLQKKIKQVDQQLVS